MRPVRATARLAGVVFVSVFAVLTSACVTPPELPNPQLLDTNAREHQNEYVIGVYDQLQITVWRQPELTLSDVVVRLDGKISFPLLDDVEASGKTPLELKNLLSERLEEFITAPHVTVVVKEIRSKTVYLIGEIVREGPLALRGEMRVVDALSSSGGFGPFADRNSIKVIRDGENGLPLEFIFDYEAFIDGANLEQNILLLPGDRIVVPEESPFWR